MKFLANLFGSNSADAKTLEQSRAQLAAAKQSAEQVAELFIAANLDLDELLAKGKTALLDVIDAEAEAVAVELSELQQEVEAANTEKAEAEAQATTAKADRDTVLAAIGAAGVKVEEGKPLAEAFPVALESRIATKARELVAATGGGLLPDKPSADAAADKSKTGRKEISHAEFNAFSAHEKMEFSKSGGRITG